MSKTRFRFRRLLGWIVPATVIALAAACATSPLGRKQLSLFPEAQMREMGAAAFQEVKQNVAQSGNTNVNRYVACVAERIVDEVPSREQRPWEVVVFKDDSANAFALPSGQIGVHTGMLDVAESQDQLAAVIGHEVAHVLAEHSNERISTAFATQSALQLAQVIAGQPTPAKNQLLGLLGLGAEVGVLLPYGRVQETEADLLGLDLMAQAGFDPRESIELWKNMARAGGSRPPEFLSTHPSSDTRIRELNARMDRALELYRTARDNGKRPRCA